MSQAEGGRVDPGRSRESVDKLVDELNWWWNLVETANNSYETSASCLEG
jgi:hypothetical protein